MSFARMQEALRAEGWFVEWNLPCCQTCAWGEVDHTDLSKVLFNHSQDCEVYDENEEDCDHCDGTGFNEDCDDDCDHCEGEGFISGGFEDLGYEPDTSVSGFVCMPPTECDGSMFCFDGTDEGVANFKAIVPLIEESGCKVNWNGSGNTRPDISWEY